MNDRSKVNVWTCVEIGLLLAVCLLYALTLSSFSGLGRSDAAGNALSEAFAFFLQVLLWIGLLAFVTMAARRRGELIAAGLVLCAAGFVLGTWSVDFVQAQPSARITPLALPPIALLFGTWARFAGAWPRRWQVAAIVAFAAAAVAAALPFILAQQRWEAAAPAREAERQRFEAEGRREEAARAAQFEAEFRALGPDSRLEQFFLYLGGEHDAEAIAKIQALPSRQADAVRLLERGHFLPDLRRLAEFGLTAGPDLCHAFHRRIDAKLAAFDPRDPGTFDEISELDTYEEAYAWLHRHGCDMSARLRRLAAGLRRHPNDYLRSRSAVFEALAREPVGVSPSLQGRG